jgi:hypothetical protein
VCQRVRPSCAGRRGLSEPGPPASRAQHGATRLPRLDARRPGPHGRGAAGALAGGEGPRASAGDSLLNGFLIVLEIKHFYSCVFKLIGVNTHFEVKRRLPVSPAK